MNNINKCLDEVFMKCENSAFCSHCDGSSLYKNTRERKEKVKKENKRIKQEEQNILRTFSKEKKEGMAFEKRVAKKWNNSFNDKKKQKLGKPRLGLKIEEDTTEDIDSSKGFQRKNITKKEVKKPEAVRQINSGAAWYSKGDIKLEHALMECKERGTKTGRGKKTISIPLEWIEKQEIEAFQENRPFWYITFGYKEHDEIYLIKSYEHEIEMIHELRDKDKEIKELKQQILKLKGGDN